MKLAGLSYGVESVGDALCPLCESVRSASCCIVERETRETERERQRVREVKRDGRDMHVLLPAQTYNTDALL